MISDEDVKQLFENVNKLLLEHIDPDKTLHTQFFRGAIVSDWNRVNQGNGGCTRHMTVFNKFNIIPKACFNCYKVAIEPRTVMELFKLMMIFDKLKLPHDNTRKCMVECREQISGTYKGYIYCLSTEEGEGITEWIHNVISAEISNKISVTLKRGCSEYALAYPEYGQIGSGTTAMEYKEEWKKYEELVDKDFIVEENQQTTFNKPSFVLSDAKVMLAWLKYAATIGDLSYLKITSEVLAPRNDIKRPTLFQSVEN